MLADEMTKTLPWFHAASPTSPLSPRMQVGIDPVPRSAFPFSSYCLLRHFKPTAQEVLTSSNIGPLYNIDAEQACPKSHGFGIRADTSASIALIASTSMVLHPIVRRQYAKPLSPNTYSHFCILGHDLHWPQGPMFGDGG